VNARIESDTHPPYVVDFESFFAANFDSLARWCSLLVQDPATGEEIAQETLVRLLARWQMFGTTDHARNYAYKTAMNLSRRLRHRAALALRFTHGLRPNGHSNEEEEVARRVDVLRALSRLSARERRCVLAVDFLGFTPVAASELLDLAPGATRVLLHRARKKLRDLTKEGYGDE
jgi:RNA polymerase sigma factor (sigma-70 family)